MVGRVVGLIVAIVAVLPFAPASASTTTAAATVHTYAAKGSYAATKHAPRPTGTKKPIDQIKVGDKVLATDPETGEQKPKKVEHVFVHDDWLTDLEFADG
ncbi:MAG: hypothetical protein ACK5MT_08345, partial [Actinomycetales bacterium]